jgi:hypothetical protein
MASYTQNVNVTSPAYPTAQAGNTKDPSRVDYRRPESAAILPDLDLMADLLAGTRRMHERANMYIRRWSAELPEVYAIRSTCETLYGGFARVLDASTGMMFAKPPVLSFANDAVADVVTPHWQNIDAAGTAGHVWARRFASWALRDGLALILVDHPAVSGTLTLADESRLNLRPTWAMYARRHILSWQTETLDNADTLTLVTLSEPTTVATGYGVELRHYIRVLRLLDGVATWEVLDITDNEDGVVVSSGVFTDRAGRPFTRLPVAVAYTGEVEAPLCARPPLLPVAWANLSHYQISTDLRFYRSLAAYPQPLIEGNLAADPTTGLPSSLNLGPMVAVRVAEGGKFSWAEISGSSLETLVSGVREKLEQMAQMGLSFIASEKANNQTAEARRLDAAGEQSTLAAAVQGIEDALNMALEYHAQYVGVPRDLAPTITLNRDYDSTTLDAQTMQALGGLIREGLPKLYAVRLLQEGGRLPAEVDAAEIAMEWEAGALASAEIAGGGPA